MLQQRFLTVRWLLKITLKLLIRKVRQDELTPLEVVLAVNEGRHLKDRHHQAAGAACLVAVLAGQPEDHVQYARNNWCKVQSLRARW